MEYWLEALLHYSIAPLLQLAASGLFKKILHFRSG